MDKVIKYYTYPSDPGMIYWEYVNKPQRRPETVSHKEREEARDKLINEETIENVGKVAATGLAVFAFYEIVKWGVAALLAPTTGGGSLAVAGCMP